jgi:hypothetical protein
MKGLKGQYSVNRKLELNESLTYFKSVIKNLMKNASKVLGEIELGCSAPEIKEKISLLDHYIDYARRLCETKDKN